MSITVSQGDKIERANLIKKLVNARYERNEIELVPGNFRVKGDTVDIIPAYSDDIVRISLFGDEIEEISICDPITLKEKRKTSTIKIFPAKHYLVAKDVREKAVTSIKGELKQRLPQLNELERQRLEMRTKFDLEMIEELGYCSGIENYSRHFDGRKPGEKAFCLLQLHLNMKEKSHFILQSSLSDQQDL